MATSNTNQIIPYLIENCKRCGKPHLFGLKVSIPADEEEKVPMFGGGEDILKRGGEIQTLFTCPETNKKFTENIILPPHRKFIDVLSEKEMSQISTETPKIPHVENEFKEWIKNSREVSREFCKTMLSTSTGAIPIYFAVLKYLGFDQIGSNTLAKFTILPPVLFLLAGILYVLALRPQYETVTQCEFSDFRKKSLEKLNLYIILGTTVFISTTGLAIVILFFVLNK